MVEVISVSASQYQLKEPVKIPRPQQIRRKHALAADREAAEREAGAVTLGEAMSAFGAEGRVRLAGTG